MIMTEVGPMSFDHSNEPLTLNERVSRARFGDEPKQYGILTEIYRSAPDGLGRSLDLYAVKWDQGYEQRGYLRQGLTKEPPNVTSQS